MLKHSYTAESYRYSGQRFDELKDRLVTINELAGVAGISPRRMVKRIGPRTQDIMTVDDRVMIQGQAFLYEGEAFPDHSGCFFSLREVSEFSGTSYFTLVSRIKSLGSNGNILTDDLIKPPEHDPMTWTYNGEEHPNLKGKPLTVSQFAALSGLAPATVRRRINVRSDPSQPVGDDLLVKVDQTGTEETTQAPDLNLARSWTNVLCSVGAGSSLLG